MLVGQIITPRNPYNFAPHSTEEYVGEVLYISNVILDPSSKGNANLFIKIKQKQFLLALLTKENPQVTLNLFISLLDEGTILVKGKATVHLIASMEPSQEDIAQSFTKQPKIEKKGIKQQKRNNEQKAKSAKVKLSDVKKSQVELDHEEDDIEDEEISSLEADSEDIDDQLFQNTRKIANQLKQVPPKSKHIQKRVNHHKKANNNLTKSKQ